MTEAQFISIIFSSGSHLGLGEAKEEELLGKSEERTHMNVLLWHFEVDLILNPESL